MPTCCISSRDAIPAGVTVLSVPTPPEILASYKIDPDHLATPDFAIELESWLAQQPPYDGPARPQPAEHDLHLGHDRPSQGGAAPCADAGAGRRGGADARR